jgi:hypothetical protein
VDRSTGERVAVEVFIAVLYPYGELHLS